MRSSSRLAMRACLLLALAISVAAFLPSAAGASPVHAGQDFFQTVSDSFQDFSAVPIPANFFDPGSDPFTGTVFLQGAPTDPTNLGTTDTIVQRLDTARFPHPFPSSDTIPIEIVALSLTSVNPITVTYNSGQNPELWDVRVTLSPRGPQQQGTMTLTHVDNAGGTFNSVLPVMPLLTFTRLSDGATRLLDFFDLGLIVPLQSRGSPWSHDAPKNVITSKRFCAGCDHGVAQSVSELNATFGFFHHVVPAVKIGS